jgi:hypothetical protein
MTIRKACSNPAHNAVLPLTAFGRNAASPDGFAYYCRACAAARQRQWKEANPEKVKQWRKRYKKQQKESQS